MVILQDTLRLTSQSHGPRSRATPTHGTTCPTMVGSRRLYEAILKAVSVIWMKHWGHGRTPRETHRQSAGITVRLWCTIHFIASAGCLYWRKSIGIAGVVVLTLSAHPQHTIIEVLASLFARLFRWNGVGLQSCATVRLCTSSRIAARVLVLACPDITRRIPPLRNRSRRWFRRRLDIL